MTLPKYQPAKHHHLIAETLQKVADGLIDRVIFNMPPRHGKTELASKRFPAWYIGKNPDKQIICCSYSDDMATDFGREVRNIINSEEYQMVFPNVKLASDSKAANRWNTNKGGAYVAAGVGGGITGKGADILLIDDPIKDREVAESKELLKKIKAWYTGVAYTRLMPGGAVVLIQTRWDDGDLAGSLIEDMDSGEGDQWTIINLPAMAMENDLLGREHGEALWPEWYDLEALNRIKKVLPSRDWNALYQQNPIPEEGDYFKTEWFQRFNLSELPKKLKIYGASDYAVTLDGGDFTEHGVFGVDEFDDLWIFDWWYGQTESDTWIDHLVGNEVACEKNSRLKRIYGLAELHQTLAWAEEKGQIEKSVGPFINKRQQEEGNYFYRKGYSSSKDKPTRARAFQGRAAQKKIHILKCDWGDRLLHQLLRFPAGKLDDGVDVCSLLGRMLAELVKVIPTKKKLTGKFPHQMSINEIIKQHDKLRGIDEWDS